MRNRHRDFDGQARSFDRRAGLPQAACSAIALELLRVADARAHGCSARSRRRDRTNRTRALCESAALYWNRFVARNVGRVQSSPRRKRWRRVDRCRGCKPNVADSRRRRDRGVRIALPAFVAPATCRRRSHSCCRAAALVPAHWPCRARSERPSRKAAPRDARPPFKSWPHGSRRTAA
jgi:hypothetical protein